jgi:hypothetical protein
VLGDWGFCAASTPPGRKAARTSTAYFMGRSLREASGRARHPTGRCGLDVSGGHVLVFYGTLE